MAKQLEFEISESILNTLILPAEVRVMNQKETKFEKMLTVADVKEYLSVTNETVYSWIKNSGLPAYRIGKRWMFDKTELDSWIKSGKAGRL